MFNKRHYEAIAETIQEARRSTICENPIDDVVRELARLFAGDNHLFNRERFIAACEPGANVKLRTRYKLPPDPLPAGVTLVDMSDPVNLHNAIADAVGEPRLRHHK